MIPVGARYKQLGRPTRGHHNAYTLPHRPSKSHQWGFTDDHGDGNNSLIIGDGDEVDDNDDNDDSDYFEEGDDDDDEAPRAASPIAFNKA